MQRRAVAISVAFFLVLSAGSYALVATTSSPTITVDEASVDHQLQRGDTFSVGGKTYSLTKVGGGSATAAHTNDSYRYTAQLSHGEQVTYQGDEYNVTIPNESDPTQFTLHEVQTIDEPTVTVNGTVYVVIEENGGDNRTLVPRDEYLPEPTTHTFEEGDTFDYQNHSTTVASIEAEVVTLEWVGERTTTVTFSQGENTTLSGKTYLAHFPSENVVVLTDDFGVYQQEVENQRYFHERTNGLWGTSIISGLAAVLLVMLAFLPPRY